MIFRTTELIGSTRQPTPTGKKRKSKSSNNSTKKKKRT